MSFTGAIINGTDIENDDDGQPSSCSTSFSVNYTAKGTFWADNVDLVITQGSAEDNVGIWDIIEDGDHSSSFYYHYPYGGANCAFRFDYILKDGQRISSTNAVMLSGSPIITNASIINNTKATYNSNSKSCENPRTQFTMVYH